MKVAAAITDLTSKRNNNHYNKQQDETVARTWTRWWRADEGDDSSKLMDDKEKQRKEKGVMVKGTAGVEDGVVSLGQRNKILKKNLRVKWQPEKLVKKGEQGCGGEEVPEKNKICMLESTFCFEGKFTPLVPLILFTYENNNSNNNNDNNIKFLIHVLNIASYYTCNLIYIINLK